MGHLTKQVAAENASNVNAVPLGTLGTLNFQIAKAERVSGRPFVWRAGRVAGVTPPSVPPTTLLVIFKI